jgi:hypothetical protein
MVEGNAACVAAIVATNNLSTPRNLWVVSDGAGRMTADLAGLTVFEFAVCSKLGDKATHHS